MAKQRLINTRFWNDSYISALDPIEKLMFVYFLTNEHTNLCGIYELPIKIIAIETGIDREMIPKIIKRFIGKIYYIDGWVCIKNFTKHQSTTSQTVQKAIENGLSEIPLQIKEKIDKAYSTDRVSVPHHISKSEFKLKSESKPKATDVAGIEGIINSFKEISPTNYKAWFGNNTQRSAARNLLENYEYEWLENLILIALPQINILPYTGRDCKAFSPYELNKNFDKIKAKIKELKLKVEEKKSKVVVI